MHLDPVDLTAWLVNSVFVAATCTFALMRGGSAERLAGAVYGLEWFSGLVIELFFHASFHRIASLPMLQGWTYDFAMAAVFLTLAVRRSNLWMAAGAAAQGVQMGVRAAAYVIGEPGTTLVLDAGVAIYAMSAVMMACIVGSTLSRRPARGRPVPA
jgi:hypothetical protein